MDYYGLYDELAAQVYEGLFVDMKQKYGTKFFTVDIYCDPHTGKPFMHAILTHEHFMPLAPSNMELKYELLPELTKPFYKTGKSIWQ